ncbi:glycosyltransferase family 4 protein [Cupriavidus respiraculi]|uniref:glycosyltransferase family 4 protein n=1 Tax=Cupriavidus respiraculi TaxID=195930 RepID=UPI001C98B7D1|nr:glycosyltransferase family 4 protein [Cupriavidus respiraculi]MBY4949087.1 glycosyltransferase family 4 protein [Cupriavidus respiraculi]
MIQRLWIQLSHIRRKVGWGQFLLFLAHRGTRELLALAVSPRAARARWQQRASASSVGQAYDFVMREAVPADPSAVVPARTVNWVIPDFGIGSGGHLNIFRFVRALEKRGYRCAIVIDGKHQFATAEKARASIRENFFPVEAQVYFGIDAMPPAEFVFATSWNTAYSVRAARGVPHKCYFVQDFEPYFYAHGSDHVLAENTYGFGFTGVTAGNWLADKLAAEYGMRTFPLGFSYDKNLYKPPLRERPATDKRRVFFYARPPTVRRAFELGVLVLSEVARRHPDVEIVMAGWDLSAYRLPFRFVDKGVMALEDLPELFYSCDVALVLSYSNASLLPVELMACGCTVVSNRGPYVEWLLDESVARLVDSNVPAIAEAICELIDNEAARHAMRDAGLRFAQATDWEREGERFYDYLEALRAPSQTAEMERI